MATEERNDKLKEQAEKEWQDLLAENTRRWDQRTELLRKQGVKFGLDGENLYKDIDEWFDAEFKKIKKKYNI